MKQELQLRFVIETEQELNALKPIWKEYYKRGIKIKESMGKYDIKTILFEKPTLKFNEFQELKKVLNTDKLY